MHLINQKKKKKKGCNKQQDIDVFVSVFEVSLFVAPSTLKSHWSKVSLLITMH